MGGRALKNTVTRRYNKREFTSISTDILRKVRREFAKAEVPRYYHNKETFGDADIIVSIEGYKGDIHKWIKEVFEPNETFSNGNCISFDYKEFQIDLMLVEGEHFDSMFNYLSFNDLGNFIGRLSHGFGLRYGQEGLWYTYFYKNTKHKLMVSKDYPKIYEFLGLDYRRWLKGFDTLEDIFEFISESPYFNWQKFQPEELNRINRERNLKRASYMTFLEWMDVNVADEDHEYKFEKDKTTYLSIIDRFFPEAGLLNEMERVDYEVSKKKYAATIFNGKLIMDTYGLTGGELGKSLQGFKEHLEMRGTDDIPDYYIQMGRKQMLVEYDYYLDVQ